MYRVKSGGEVELREGGEQSIKALQQAGKRGVGEDVCHLSACRNSRSGSLVSEGSERGREDGPVGKGQKSGTGIRESREGKS